MTDTTPNSAGEQDTAGWSVRVCRYDDLIVSISERELAGKDITEADAELIRLCANHLRAFIGEPKPSAGETPAAPPDPWGNVKQFKAAPRLTVWSDETQHELIWVYRVEEVDAARATERQHHADESARVLDVHAGELAELHASYETTHRDLTAARAEIARLTEERDAVLRLNDYGNREAVAAEASLLALRAAHAQLSALCDRAVSSRVIVADQIGTAAPAVVFSGRQRFGHNPSWVKAADVRAALAASPPHPETEGQ